MSRPHAAASPRAPRSGHALVIGGSMAGLLAARVLTAHFAHVTIVERDHVPGDATPRAGVPQARHVHILLLEGQRLLERFFPGLGRDLTAAGAPTVDMIRDFPAMGLGGWAPRFPSPFIARTCSRNLLEATIRQRLLATGRVAVRPERQVTALLATESA